jgi:hypothetical protein
MSMYNGIGADFSVIQLMQNADRGGLTQGLVNDAVRSVSRINVASCSYVASVSKSKFRQST